MTAIDMFLAVVLVDPYMSCMLGLLVAFALD